MASILRDSANQRAAQSRLPVSGKIRPGTKTISKNAAQNPLALALFNKAKQGLISFKDAEKEISDKLNIKFPFYPTNTQHFNVYPHDVEGGKNTVDLILGKYGEMRDGDTEQKLYSFPVVFPDLPNGIEGIFPSEYRVDAGAVKYHSAYGDDGVRRCLYLKAVDAKEQATCKKWLRRTESVRGECNPSSCSEFSKVSAVSMARCSFTSQALPAAVRFRCEQAAPTQQKTFLCGLKSCTRFAMGFFRSLTPGVIQFSPSPR